MKKTLITSLIISVAATAASAAIIKVTSDITTDTSWSASNEYILTDIIYVRNNATLTIAPGTVVRGEPKSGSTSYDPGALVVTRQG